MCKLNPLCKSKPCSCADWEKKLQADDLSHLDCAVYDKRGRKINDLLTVSNKGSGKLFSEQGFDNRLMSEEAAEEARDILAHYTFKDARQRDIFRRHTDGDGMKKIASALGISFRQVHKIITDVTERWREKQRQAPKVTKALIEQTDPEVLTALLEVLD